MKDRALVLLLCVIFSFSILSAVIADVHALGGEKGEPEVTVYAEIADDGTLMGVGIENPSPMSNSFIPLSDPYLGTVHTNDLWFIVYVPKSLKKDDIKVKIDTWKEKTVKIERALDDGTVEVTTGMVKYDEESDTFILPVKRGLYLEEHAIKTHKNLTHVRITYDNLKWEFEHKSTPATVKVDWVHNEGDVWFLYLKAIFVTMINAFISFGIGSRIIQVVRYVPPISVLETVIAVLLLVFVFDASYSWLEFNVMNYKWYIMQLPATVIMTFLSLQFFKADERRILNIGVPPQEEDGPNVELFVKMPLIVKGPRSDIENDDILVHKWSWWKTIWRFITGGPKVSYEGHQKFHTVDVNGVFDEIYMLHPEEPSVFIHPHIEWKFWELDRRSIIELMLFGILAVVALKLFGGIAFLGVLIFGFFMFNSYIFNLDEGVATVRLAPAYEGDKYKHMCGIDVIHDNNMAREDVEKQLYEATVKSERRATEKAFEFVKVVGRELFGMKEEPEKKEEPKEETLVKEPEEVVEEIEKKKEPEK